MPRYGTRTLLIVFSLVAVWFATFGASTTSLASMMAAQDLRRSMLLLVLVAVTVLALTRRGKPRAFWAAFAIVMFLCGGINLQRPLYRYVPDFAWQQLIGANVPTPYMAPVPTAASATARGQVVYSYSSPAISPYFPGGAVMGGAPGWSAFSETAAAAWTFAISALSGFVAAFTYSRARPIASGASTAARQIVEQELRN